MIDTLEVPVSGGFWKSSVGYTLKNAIRKLTLMLSVLCLYNIFIEDLKS